VRNYHPNVPQRALALRSFPSCIPWKKAAIAIALAACASSALGAGGRIDAADLLAGTPPSGVVENSAFVPGPGAQAAHEPFAGMLTLAAARMTTVPEDLGTHEVLGKDPQYFPAVALSFVTVDGDLVPATQNVLRAGSIDRGRSYWDVLVQPGRVWSETRDRGWSRAAFPFALVHSLEGETHNGIATFLYRRGAVSSLRFQIVQQTTPGNITAFFPAAGVTKARFDADASLDQAGIASHHRRARADEIAVRDWGALERRVGRDRLAGFTEGLRPDEIIVTGLDYHGRFYASACASAGGPLPWCERARFGVWSVTKSFANEVALLRLAQKFGPEVFELRVRDYVPEAAAYPAWANVRFEDCIDMATGVGNGSTRRNPNDSGDGYIDATYWDWANTRTRADKVAMLLRVAPAYPWGPGEVTRYRDQDMYILGVAMDNFLRTREGPAASLWSMLEREVFEPIGVHDAPINRTLESDGSAGQPLMAYGYYATLGDLVKVARLFHARGRHGDLQILYAPRIERLLYSGTARGLPTGTQTRDGEMQYYNGFWHMRYQAIEGCSLYLPQMLGWGGNVVALFPGGLTGIRIARSAPERFAAQTETTAMAVVANRLARFCP